MRLKNQTVSIMKTTEQYKGKAIYPPLKTGNDYDRFNVRLTPGFEQLRVKALELLLPFAEKSLDEESRTLTYFTLDDDNIGEDVCDSDECEGIALEELKKEYPDNEIEVHHTQNDGDHENLENCSVCSRPLNTQLTWVGSEFDYVKENKYTKKFIKDEAFTIYCILDAIPSCDHNPSKWAINEYEHGRTFHIDSRTEFYEQLMKLADKVVKIL